MRVARASRPLAEREGHGEVVDLLGRGQHASLLRLRGRAVGRVREVLLLDPGADPLGKAGEPRVLGADVTFQVGELPHELGRLVRLGQSRGLV